MGTDRSGEADTDLADDLAATVSTSHSLWDTFMGR
jgi:hypothetical protein